MEYSDNTRLPEQIAYERLENQISWYDSKSVFNQKRYKQIKFAQLLISASIGIIGALRLSIDPAYIISVLSILGIVITTLESVSHLNQYQNNWMTYRSTCEALRHEKELYNSKAGAYTGSLEPWVMLSERVESLVSTEHAKWSTITGTSRILTLL